MSLDGGTEQILWALSSIPSGAPADNRDVRVLLAMLTFRNRSTGLAWPSGATVAKRAGVSERSVTRAIESLIERGLIAAAGTAKAVPGKGTIKYRFMEQPQPPVAEPQPAPTVAEPQIQPRPTVAEPIIQPLPPVAEPEPRPTVAEPEPASATPVPQVAPPVADKPLLEPQLPISSSSTTSPVEEWTGPTEQNLAWLAAQVSTKVEGCVIELDSITEKMMKLRNPEMTEAKWRQAALALLGYWQSKADADSSFKDTRVAGDEIPTVRDGEWRPEWDDVKPLYAQYPLLEKQRVRHEITRQFLDWCTKIGRDPFKDPAWSTRIWQGFVEKNYEEAKRGHPADRHPQMTGTE